MDYTGLQKKESPDFLTRVGVSDAFRTAEHEYDVQNALSHQNFCKIHLRDTLKGLAHGLLAKN